MEYNGEGVHALVCAVEDLESSNLIFIDRKLKPLLKCLAYYPEFRSVLRIVRKVSITRRKNARLWQNSETAIFSACQKSENARSVGQ